MDHEKQESSYPDKHRGVVGASKAIKKPLDKALHLARDKALKIFDKESSR